MKSYSTDEKIEFIFKELRAQKRTRILNLFLKISIFWFIIFLYMTYIHWVSKEELIKDISIIFWELIKPIVNDLANEMIKNNEQIINN